MFIRKHTDWPAQLELSSILSRRAQVQGVFPFYPVLSLEIPYSSSFLCIVSSTSTFVIIKTQWCWQNANGFSCLIHQCCCPVIRTISILTLIMKPLGWVCLYNSTKTCVLSSTFFLSGQIIYYIIKCIMQVCFLFSKHYFLLHGHW